MKKKILLLSFLLLYLFNLGAQELPHIVENKSGVKQLIVKGEPFIIMGGELNNSSASNLDYLAPIMNNLRDRYLNTVIAPVYWELFEPEEGKFDFTLIKGIIDQAREYDLKLILLWFGTWKNTWSTYCPEWVKKDLEHFPRMQRSTGENSGAISAFSRNAMDADIKAFSEFMKYLRKYDSKEQTVLMIQVENESGIVTSNRDNSEIANRHFYTPVPQQLLDFLNTNKDILMPEVRTMLLGREIRAGLNWEELFGYGADEAFSAWYIASYIQEVIEAGKAEYNLPMFVNAWIDGSFSKNLKPDYPIGGPVSKMFDIWRAAAPLIDVFAADIYIEDIKKVCEMYSQQGNPIFIPEAKESPRQAANVYYVIGQNGMCFAPFGIDGLFKPEVAAVVAESYKSLKGFLPFFAGHCGKDKNKGLLYTGEKIEEFEMGSYKIRVEYLQERDEANNLSESGGLILNSAENEFYICGFQIRVHFSALQGENKHAEVISHDEGVFDNGKWMPERRMNGDELGIWLQKPTIRKVKFHKYDL